MEKVSILINEAKIEKRLEQKQEERSKEDSGTASQAL